MGSGVAGVSPRQTHPVWTPNQAPSKPLATASRQLHEHPSSEIPADEPQFQAHRQNLGETPGACQNFPGETATIAATHSPAPGSGEATHDRLATNPNPGEKINEGPISAPDREPHGAAEKTPEMHLLDGKKEAVASAKPSPAAH